MTTTRNRIRVAPAAVRTRAPARPDLAALVGPARIGVPLVAAAAVIAVAVMAVADLRLPSLVGLPLIVGAIVVAGLVARRSLLSVAAGAGLRLARPYADGEQVRIWLPALAADVRAEVLHIGVANTSLRTSMGELLVPNKLLVQASPHDQATPELPVA